MYILHILVQFDKLFPERYTNNIYYKELYNIKMDFTFTIMNKSGSGCAA